MVKFTVVWHRSAEDDLAELWITSLAPSAITRAADAIDSELRFDAHMRGAPLGGANRLIYKYPLQVLIRVRMEDRIVEVLRLKLDVTAG